MDGMLLVTFFFPMLVSFNIALSITTFALTLIVSFSEEISSIIADLFVNINDILLGSSSSMSTGPAEQLVNNLQEFIPSYKKPLSVFWSVFVSGVTIWTTLSTYGFGGAARHGKKGWRFVQPGAGGVRFILVQVLTWITFSISVGIPWTNLKNVGWLTALGVIQDREEDPASHRGLIVVGSALGMLSNTFCILGLMSFDPKEKIVINVSRQRRNLELGKWRWNIFGDSELWWWLFLMLQGTFVVFSWQLAVMLEMSKQLKNNIVESLLLMVVSSLLLVPLALTNAIAGKWRHGERHYRLAMPCQGGFLFVLLQGLGWTLFAGAFVMTLLKLYATATASNTKVSISSTASLGFVSYLCIVASLFYFDPTKVTGLEEAVEEEDDAADETSSRASSHTNSSKQQLPQRVVHSVLGKRQSPSVKGALEYLVQWKATSPPNWILEELLMKEDPDAIKMNERSVRTPRIGSDGAPKPSNSKGRSISPKLRPARVVHPHHHQQQPQQGVDEDEDEDMEDEDEEDEVEESYSGENTDSDSEDVWEEVEDEHGNVFYINDKKKLTQTSIPKQLQRALQAGGA